MRKNNRKILGKVINKIETADVIAVMAMITWAVLSWRGISVMVSPAIFLIFGYYFRDRSHKLLNNENA